ncbi:MAG: recombinase RecB [Acidilobus sp.]
MGGHMGGALRESEEIASRFLEGLGFRVVERRMKVIVDGVEVSDIDMVAEKDGVRHAVEVKAGYVDVSSIRQAYVNSVLTGMKPLLVARGFSDESAVVVARRLGVQVVTLSDQLYVQPDELFELVEGAVEEALEKVTRPLSFCGNLNDEQGRVLKAIASSDDFMSSAQALGLRPDELGRVLEGLRAEGLIPRGSFQIAKVASRLLVLCQALIRADRQA